MPDDLTHCTALEGAAKRQTTEKGKAGASHPIPTDNTHFSRPRINDLQAILKKVLWVGSSDDFRRITVLFKIALLKMRWNMQRFPEASAFGSGNFYGSSGLKAHGDDTITDRIWLCP